MAAALGITVYWPVVCLATLVDARGAHGWNITEETPYWVVLSMIAAWGAWGLIAVSRIPQPSSAPDAKSRGI